MPQRSSIQIMDDTRELLRRKGEKGESYDNIIRKLLGVRPR